MGVDGLTLRAERIGRTLKYYFDVDGRYFLASYVGSGFQAEVFKIRKTNGWDTRGEDQAVVKIPFNSGKPLFGGILTYMDEKEALKVLRGATHVVRILDMQDTDPLKRAEGSLPVNDWIYLEYLPNGTLYTFLTRASQQNIALPNRLLWRMLMCFARMGAALSWPDRHGAGVTLLEDPEDRLPPHVIINTDPSAANMVFGEFVSAQSPMEHDIMPILKMIDLGFVEKRLTPTQEVWEEATKDYILRIGTVMGKAVAAGRALGFAQGSGVDPLLREMIFACQSFDLNKRPTLNELLHGTMDAIQTRTAEWYRVNQGSLVKSQVDPGREEDGAILQLMHDLIINAPAGA